MQNNTNALNELLQVANALPDASSGGGECNATQDFFVDTNGIHSIALDGTLTLLDIEDLDDASDNSFMEYCRTNIFQMGGVNRTNYPDSANPGRQGARGRFLFGDFDASVHPNLYMYFHDNVVEAYKIDSMIIECIGGPGTGAAECTIIANVYTVDAQHYHLQICCKGGAYNTDGWQLVSYGSSSDSGGFKLYAILESVEEVNGEHHTCLLSTSLVSDVLYLVRVSLESEGIILSGVGFIRATPMGSFNASRIFLYAGEGNYIGEVVVYSATTVGGPANYLSVIVTIDENNDMGITQSDIAILTTNIYTL